MLGSARSEEPLILPLEAIELDAFRRHHAENTFWCGLLLGGCGTQLTTKLYTDRVCHFSHLPDPTGLHVCGRRARDVSSADHLYVKSAAIAWLHQQDHAGAVHLREPLGSVVDIAWEHGTRGLRLHLDNAVPPVWDDDKLEPVLGTTVPVDDATLAHRGFVHRVRFDSVGTNRHVRIGTQTLAQETEWFGLGECSMTPDGLRTPAVERAVRTRRPGAPQNWKPPVPEGRRTEPHPARRRLEAAMEAGSRAVIEGAYRDLKATGPDWGPATQEVAAELRRARLWLDAHHREQQGLFESLRQAVQAGDTKTVFTLYARVDTTARDRTPKQQAIAISAVNYLRVRERAARDRRDQEHPEPDPRPVPPESAQRRVQDILRNLKRLGNKMEFSTTLATLESLATVMKIAGHLVAPAEREEAELWLERSRGLRATSTKPTTREPIEATVARSRPADNRGTHDQQKVARRWWIERPCSRCGANPGQDCRRSYPRGPGQRYLPPHDERIQPILDERRARERR